MLNPNQKVHPIKILLVEDNPGDVILTQEAFFESRLSIMLETVENAEDALAYLRNDDKAVPDLVLMDINLPGMSGLEALTAIKEDLHLRRIPVVILTTSSSDQDVLHAYDHFANCYITKPVQFEDFQNVIKGLEDFWFTIVRLPKP
jgi:two-component system response regulator